MVVLLVLLLVVYHEEEAVVQGWVQGLNLEQREVWQAVYLPQLQSSSPLPLPLPRLLHPLNPLAPLPLRPLNPPAVQGFSLPHPHPLPQAPLPLLHSPACGPLPQVEPAAAWVAILQAGGQESYGGRPGGGTSIGG